MDLDPAPFLRGAAWPAGGGAAYPRADPADAARLPADTWGTALLPVGVRLELVGDAAELEIDCTCLTDDLGYRGAGAGTTYAVWRGDEQVSSAPAAVGDATMRLALGAGEGVAVVHLPEGMRPEVRAIRALGGSVEPAPAGPRWLAYGDSITEGWVASQPALAWPHVAARRGGLDVVNLGYAGAARGEIASAEQIAALPGDVVSVAYGTNCWSRIPHSTGMLREGLRAFLAVLRQGHPRTPLVVLSPILRPDAEDSPNRLGATLADLRAVVEEVTAELAAEDDRIVGVAGLDLIGPDLLPDGIHPGDEGHAVLTDAYGAAVQAALQRAAP